MNITERASGNNSRQSFSPILFTILTVILMGGFNQAQSQWATSGNNINNTNTGNVGIGTSAPGGKLQVAGDTYVGSNDGTIPYAVSIGASGNGYGGIGYGMKFSTTSNAYTYSANDFASMLHFHSGGFRFRTAPLGTSGNAVTFTDIITGLNNGNVGIGTTTPSYRLHVAGNNTAAGGYPIVKLQNTQTGGHSYWLYSGANGVPGDFGLFDETDNLFRLYVKGGTGNIGMGTSAPRSALDIAGGESYVTVGAAGSFGSGAILSGSTGSTFLSNNVYLNAAASQFKVVDPGKISAGLQLAGRDVYFRSFSAAATPLHTELLFINGTSGNVGIGTITPAHKLDLVGSLNASGGLCIAGDCKTSWSQVGGGTTSQWTTSGSNIYYNTGNVSIGTASGVYRFDVQSTSSLIARFGSSAAMHNQVLFDAPAGYNSNITFQHAGIPKWYLGNRAENNRFSIIESTGSVEVLAISQNGSIGVGTINPASLLHVNSGAGPASGQFKISANNAGSLSGIAYSPNNVALGLDVDYSNGAWIARDSTVAALYKTSGKFFIQGSAGNGAGGAATLNNYMAVDLSNGNVGVGTTSPTTKLHVVGDITVTGNINAKYQDVAEWVPSRQKLTPGTVVVLDPEQSNHVMASSSAYDTSVAGVVSAQPGVLLGEAGENKSMIATTGRVKVKVVVTSSPIKVGDLLVTSDVEGVAMKSEPLMIQGRLFHSPGTLIGKALEPLAKGTGEILVLLSLQ